MSYIALPIRGPTGYNGDYTDPTTLVSNVSGSSVTPTIGEDYDTVLITLSLNNSTQLNQLPVIITCGLSNGATGAIPTLQFEFGVRVVSPLGNTLNILTSGPTLYTVPTGSSVFVDTILVSYPTIVPTGTTLEFYVRSYNSGIVNNVTISNFMLWTSPQPL